MNDTHAELEAEGVMTSLHSGVTSSDTAMTSSADDVVTCKVAADEESGVPCKTEQASPNGKQELDNDVTQVYKLDLTKYNTQNTFTCSHRAPKWVLGRDPCAGSYFFTEMLPHLPSC